MLLLVGWLVFAMKPEKSSSKLSTISKQPSGVQVLLVDATTGRPISGIEVRFRSDNGVRCVTDPCEDNTRSLNVTSDDAGKVLIPQAYIQQENFIESGAYLPARLDVRPNVNEYTAMLHPGQ